MNILSSLTFCVAGITLIFIGCVIAADIRTFRNLASVISISWGTAITLTSLYIPSLNVSPFGILYIFLCVVSYSMWHILLKNFRTSKSYVQTAPFKNDVLLTILTLICISTCAAAIINVFVVMQQDPVRVLTNLLEASGKLAATRGNTSVSIGFAASLVANTAYLSVILLAFRHNITTPLIIFHFTPALLATLLLSQKLIMLVAIISYFLMTIILQQMHGRSLPRTNQKSNKVNYLLIISIITIALLFSFISREGYNVLNGEGTLKKFFMTISSYFLGSIVAFSYFFDDYMNITWQNENSESLRHYHYMLGRFTFSGYISQNIDTTYYSAAGDPNSIRSNIYTIFRGLIYDFGLIGGYLFFNLLGILNVLLMRPWTFGVKSGLIVASTFYCASFGLIGYLISPASARYTVLLSAEIFVLVAIVFPISQRITWR